MVAVAAVIAVVAAAVMVAVTGDPPAAVAVGLDVFTGVVLSEWSFNSDNRDELTGQVGGAAGLIVSPEKVLLLDCAANSDQATELAYDRRAAVLYPYVSFSPFKTKMVSLIGARDTRPNVKDQLESFHAGYVSANGHGLAHNLCGWWEHEYGGPFVEVIATRWISAREARISTQTSGRHLAATVNSLAGACGLSACTHTLAPPLAAG
jgi:hypothetical protein